MDINMGVLILGAILVNNVVLARFLGICPFLGVSKKLDSAFGMSVAVTVVLVLATAATWPIQTYILDEYGLGYMQTVVFIVVIASLVQLIEIFLKKFIPALHKALGIYLPLITTNCAVLGVTIINIEEGYSFSTSLIYAASVGVGFLLAMIMFAGVRGRIENCDIPKAFDGIPKTLIAASIVSLSLAGFAGVAEGIFSR